jgi:3-carboxy-cis,cis-muconate cycloisomerase
MARNLGIEQGRLLAEAYLFELAPRIGREAAHDLVYDAATRSKAEGIDLHEAVTDAMRASGMSTDGVMELVPAEHTGTARDEALAAVADWRRSRSAA